MDGNREFAAMSSCSIDKDYGGAGKWKGGGLKSQVGTECVGCVPVSMRHTSGDVDKEGIFRMCLRRLGPMMRYSYSGNIERCGRAGFPGFLHLFTPELQSRLRDLHLYDAVLP